MAPPCTDLLTGSSLIEGSLGGQGAAATSLPLAHGPRRLAKQQRRRGYPYPTTAPLDLPCSTRVDAGGLSGPQSFEPTCSGFGTRGHAPRFVRMSGWIEDDMNRHDQLLDRQMSRFQLPPRRDGVLILAMAAVFIAGPTAGGLLFTFGNAPSTPTASDDGRTALAFLLNGTGSPSRQ